MTDAALSPVSFYKNYSTAVACLLFQFFGIGLFGLYGFFVNPVAESFGKEIAIINLGLTIMLVLGAIGSPILGAIIDRSKLKPLILLGGLLTGGGLLLVSIAQQFSALVFGYVLAVIGIILYGPLVINLLLVRSYNDTRARAMAIAAIGVSLSSIILPMAIAALFEVTDWRQSLQIIAVAVALGVTFVVLFAVKEPPRNSVTSSVSAPSIKLAGDNPDVAADAELTAFSRQRNFWLMGLAYGLVNATASMMVVVYVPHFLNVGLSNTDAAWLMAAAGVCGMTGKLTVAMALDRARNHVRLIAAGLALLQAGAWLLFFLSQETLAIAIAVCLVGFVAGIYIPLLPFMNSVFFTESVLGRVNGLHMSMMLPFAILGPWLAGVHFDTVGNYNAVFLVLGIALLVVALMFLLLKRPLPND